MSSFFFKNKYGRQRPISRVWLEYPKKEKKSKSVKKKKSKIKDWTYSEITSAILAKAGWTVSNCAGSGLDVSEPPLFEAASTKLNKKHLTFSLPQRKKSSG